jgi:hypothetical protein
MPRDPHKWMSVALAMVGIQKTAAQINGYLTLADIEIEKEKIMRYAINGIVLEGSQEAVTKFAQQHGIELQGYYRSETHGYIPIASMQTQHIRNAVLKAVRCVVDSTMKDASVPLTSLFDLSTYPKEIQALVAEYRKR